MCHGATKLAKAPADSSQRTQEPRNGRSFPTRDVASNAHLSTRSAQIHTRSAQFPTRCVHALRRQTKKTEPTGWRIDIVIVRTSSWSRRLGKCVGNGLGVAQTIGATAMGLVDSPVVELFAVTESMVLLLGILLFLKDVFLCLSLGLRDSLRRIPCERSSKWRPFQSQCA